MIHTIKYHCSLCSLEGDTLDIKQCREDHAKHCEGMIYSGARDYTSVNPVDRPPHYGGDTPYEVIKVIEAWGLDKDFHLGNTIKYIARSPHKGNELQDLEKAAWYLARRIAKLKEDPAK